MNIIEVEVTASKDSKGEKLANPIKRKVKIHEPQSLAEVRALEGYTEQRFIQQAMDHLKFHVLYSKIRGDIAKGEEKEEYFFYFPTGERQASVWSGNFKKATAHHQASLASGKDAHAANIAKLKARYEGQLPEELPEKVSFEVALFILHLNWKDSQEKLDKVLEGL
jgi:hypothetical protein